MPNFLNNIRPTERKIPMKRKAADTIIIMLFGILLGIISKYLDCTASNELPFIIAYLDVRNFFGRFAIWIFLAVCISIYSISAIRASINVFLFFTGMIASYYLYSNFVAGFFPRSYAMIWIGFTIISPLPAFICWYSKGRTKASLILSAGIIGILFNMTFVYGWIYFDMRSILELLVFIGGIAVLRRATPKATMAMIALGVVFAFIIHCVFPFYFA